VDIATTAESS